MQKENEMALPNSSGFFSIGDTISFPPRRTFVSKLPSFFLRQAFDISKDLPIPNDCPLEYRFLYNRIPEYSEILELVSLENARRANTGQPRIKLNVELKGPGTGAHVQKALSDFNAKKQGGQKIRQEEIYYMSFRDTELAVIAGLTHRPGVVPCPNANLILGVPTAVQYMQIGDGYAIKDSRINQNALSKKVLPLHQALKSLPERKGTGLTGVDMSLWDVSQASIDYFCKTHKLPIHIAVVPFGPNDLHAKHIKPALINIERTAKAQSMHLDQNMIIKTDNPTLLRQMVLEMGKSQKPIILDAKIKQIGAPSSQRRSTEKLDQSTIQLFQKPGTKAKPPQQITPDRSWWSEKEIIPALQKYTKNAYVTISASSSKSLDKILDDVTLNVAQYKSVLIPLNVNVITRELNNKTNHWVGLQVFGNNSAISVNYIDPMGQQMSQQIRQQILNKFGYETVINQPLLGKAIQNAKIVKMGQNNPILVCQGNDYD
ncbi:MAG: hypothetical protein AAF673_04955, partial [Pseudomonadota bacterium]